MVRARSVLPAALAAALVAGPAAAHPHVFVDATLTLRFDAEGRLAELSTTWTYDEFYTLYAIEAMEMDADGDGVLTGDELAEMARIHTEPWPDQEQLASQLWLTVGGAAAGLALPAGAEARIEGDRLVVSFARAVAAPADPAEALSVRLYDPSYFIAYEMVGSPAAEGLPVGCALRYIPFDPDAELAALQTELAAIPADETPDFVNVGALFADEVRVTCGQ